MRARTIMTLILSLSVTLTSEAGKYNPVLNIGDVAPKWTNLPGVDDKEHSYDDLADKVAVIVVFTCNSCPYAVDAEDRLVALHKKYADAKVALVAINVNKVEEDLMPAMKERAKAKSFEFPYLFDETQQIAKEFGAGYTPEFFVLDASRKVVYMGSLDDSPDASKAKVCYVDAAIAAIKAGESPMVTESVPIGCRVRYERQRRRRKRD